MEEEPRRLGAQVPEAPGEGEPNIVHGISRSIRVTRIPSPPSTFKAAMVR